MNNLNSVLIEGYLTDNPSRLDFADSKAVLCRLRIANNRFYKKNGEQVQETSYFTIDVWGNTAENCARYLKKGSGVRVVGRIKQERWKDAEDHSRNMVKIIAEQVDFFSSNAARKTASAQKGTTHAQAGERGAAAPHGSHETEEDTEVINL